MVKNIREFQKYTFYEYVFEQTTVRYVVMKEEQNVFLLLIPNELIEKTTDDFETHKLLDNGFVNNEDWYPGSLVHLHLSHHYTPMYDNGYKFSQSTKNLKYQNQEFYEENNVLTIKTYLAADEGYEVCHVLTKYNGENGFEIKNILLNKTGKEITLEMITSATLDNLSPFFKGTATEDLVFHYFKGGWSIEGKHIATPISEMNMDKSWGGSFESEKIGAIGSKTVGRFYPYAALEDKSVGCLWGMKIKHNATWQAELSRYGTPLSLSIGIGDYKFGHWRKILKNNDSFETPVAYVAACTGSIDELSNDLIKMNDKDIENYGEQGMPIIFNDWVTHWGDSSFKKAVSLADSLKKSKVKYFVLDDGWQSGGVGDWTVDNEKFPGGLKDYSKAIRDRGMIPGIWMEFETIRDRALRWSSEFDEFNLTKDGVVINNAACNSAQTKFLDFRKKEVRDYLDKVVIEFLKKNNIGYIKVDYNSNIGLGCDGAESLGEGLRQHMNYVYEFFIKMKKEIPDIIIENCSTGGSRLDPKMMGVTAMSSFSDAHESIDLPIIAANMHYFISPRQNQVWCVVKSGFETDRIKYSIAAGFLGRLCWSGNIDNLREEQMEMIYNAEKMYDEVSHIIKAGRSYIIRTDSINNRNPQGSQAAIRYSEDKKEALVVVHYFNNSKEMKLLLNDEYVIKSSLYEGGKIEGKNLILEANDISANVYHLVLKR